MYVGDAKQPEETPVDAGPTDAKDDPFRYEAMLAGYVQAIERAIARLPVKNGIVDIDAIWIETSIPYDLLRTLLQREDLKLPENVERINLKSNVRKVEQRGSSKQRRRR